MSDQGFGYVDVSATVDMPNGEVVEVTADYYMPDTASEITCIVRCDGKPLTRDEYIFIEHNADWERI